MGWQTGDVVTPDFCLRALAGGSANADSTPTGTLVINGTDNAAVVTVTNKAMGSYKASVTLPAITAGDLLQLRIAATVDGVSEKAVVWAGQGDVRVSAVSNILGAFTGTGVNTVLGFLKALASKVATLPSDIGGTFNPATDSLEAIQEQLQDVEDSTDSIVSFGHLSMVGSVLPGGDSIIIQGDDYTGSRRLSWPVPIGTADLTDAEQIEFRLNKGELRFSTNEDWEIEDEGESVQTVKVTLTTEQTSALAAGRWRQHVIATLADGSIATVVSPETKSTVIAQNEAEE